MTGSFRGAIFALGEWVDADALRQRFPHENIFLGLHDAAAAMLCVTLEEVFATNPRAILYLEAGSESVSAAESLRQAGPMLTLLVPHRLAPVAGARHDGEVRDFVCAPELLRSAMVKRSGTLCYDVARAALANPLPVHISVSGSPVAAARPGASVAVIIPHRGSTDRLHACLLHSTAACPDANFLVGIDETVTDVHHDIVNNFPDVRFFSVQPDRAGPYVIRQFLIEQSEAAFVAFQDSDDTACAGRFAVQIQAAKESGAAITGCHELRLEEESGTVEAIRYPGDVNAALADPSAHVQLAPTTVLSRKAFLRAGGFSTRRRFASDREFLLRANLLAEKIINCDAFLYVRVRHRQSLTMDPATAPGSRYRKRFTELWESDARAVAGGTKSVAFSALRPRHLFNKTYRFTDMRSGIVYEYSPQHSAV